MARATRVAVLVIALCRQVEGGEFRGSKVRKDRHYI